MALRGQSLAKLEVLSNHLFEGTDLVQQMQAEKIVLELINSPDCLSQCQLLLEQGTTSYAQVLAATCLSRLVSRASPLPIEQRIVIRNYLLNYIASQPKLAPFVMQALVQVIAKITKLGWFEVLKDQLVFRDITADVKKFLQGTVDHCIIGVMILSELTQEMNLVSMFLSLCKEVFLEPETLDLFFDLYHSLPPMLSQSGLSDPGNYHEFCRFLARLKTNYQLGELAVVEGYPEVIQLIANFTITSLQHWQFAPNSVHYLLTLWQRLVASVPFVKTAEPHLLDTYAPEITKAYITSRLECVPIVIRDGLEDPLDDTPTVFQQLEQLCTISRCEYEKTCTLLVQLFDQNAQNYQKLLHSSSRNPLEITVQEGRLAWLVYFVGTFVGGRLTYTSTDEHDAMDGELSCRVFQLMSLTDAHLLQSSNEKVELAILWFLDQFRKTYVGDQLQHTPKAQVLIQSRIVKYILFLTFSPHIITDVSLEQD
ncbi:hypothetical protein ASZ78_007389 [Callipepla squamata]|uniref:Importin N-terminal domain-containing protein n=1 Tax=Callipepla squamata TaxID=9009 RepID=A0A226NBI7_CALSU|nr:hypothetical protein ASZ78_007389 [Callipepla squamata]